MAALAAQPMSTNPFKTSVAHTNPKDSPKDEWEDWDVDSDNDDDDNDDLLIDLSGNGVEAQTRKSSHKHASNRLTHRPVHLPRVKSRGRQGAKNAKANIKLVTDMSQFQQARVVALQRGVDTTNKGRFADTAALRALEGSPNSASMGSFAWLYRKPENAQNLSVSEYTSTDLSPNARPIVIGISVPSDEAGSHQVSPQTAVVETPMDVRSFSRKASGKAPTPQQLHSVWSPDTETTDSPYSVRRPASSVYSQYNPFGASKIASDAPPVPNLPATMNLKQAGGLQFQDDEDSGTPYTPFEEDDTPVATSKSQNLKTATASPGSASSRAHGWWDHVTTPFTPQLNNPFKTQSEQAGPSNASSQQGWWSGVDEKKGSSAKTSHLTIITPANQRGNGFSTVDTIMPAPAQESHEQNHSEKARIALEDNQANDAPPPYEFPKTQVDAKFAVPQPYVSSQPIPSPGPLTPGLAATMSSQRGVNLAEIPLTPLGVLPVPPAVLPNRPVGSYRTGDHFYEAPGKANKIERQRRRHEKEDVVARKIGGLWRGRGCIPEEGCFGRSGREGRKRRRVCLGIFGGVIAAIILIVVLVVVLTRRAMSSPPAGANPPGTPEVQTPPEPTYWLNLTSFPPMPTGVLTVAGPNNSVAESGCFIDGTPSTAWSCALPKERHDSVAPYAPNQPEFIFQIQFDNSTQALWKLADKATKNTKGQGYVFDDGFEPKPAPPSLQEVKFLGNTTDDIKSDRKEGEPTPFFISLLESIEETVGPDMIMKRQGNAIGGSPGNGTSNFNLSEILPPPELNPDGTGAPARLFPRPVQQPVRLFDRDLPTEHYGFYTYFDKTIYLADNKKRNIADKDGGVPIENATAVVTFAQTRFLVKIWTRLENTASLLGSGGSSVNVTATPEVQPGSMPYPVTIIADMHGGDQSAKTDFSYGVLKTMEIDRSAARGIIVDVGFGGTLVNGRVNDGDIALGGIDGGTGGCKCEWVNFEN